MAHSSLVVANTFLDLAESEGEGITPMKLIKLIYMAQGWNLALTENTLINEPVEAWQYGPVIPSVYHEFKRYGNQNITGKGFQFYGSNADIPKNCHDYKLIKKVWDVYKQFTGIQLSNITHEPETPWSQTYDSNTPTGKDIDNEKIKKHFTELAKLSNA